MPLANIPNLLGRGVQVRGGVTPSIGNVVGPASATLNAVARYADTTGKVIKDSPNLTATDAGNLLFEGIVDGTGKIQLKAATTSAGGITFGTANFYTSSDGNWTLLRNTNGNTSLTLNSNSSSVITMLTDGTNGFISATGTLSLRSNGTTTALTIDSSQTCLLAKKISSYNGVTTTGWGVGAMQAAVEVTAQSAANASIATYTVGAADGTFRVSAQLDCTAATVLSTSLFLSYTDKGNTARTMIFPVAQLAGSFIAAGAITGTGAWETPVMHIRCKASTAITIGTSAGTFNTVTYSADGIIEQVA